MTVTPDAPAPEALLAAVRGALRPAVAGTGAEAQSPPASVALAPLLALTARNRCLPFVLRAFEKGALRPQDDAAALRLSRLRLGLAARQARQQHALAALLATLREAGVPVLLFKGPALAFQCFGDPAMRDSDDLDLLVRAADFPRARRALLAAGCVERLPLSEAEAVAQMRAGWDCLLFRTEEQVLVELSTTVCQRFVAHVPEDWLWRGAETVRPWSLDAAAPAPETLAVLLCLHGGKHGWDRLVWVADLCALFGRAGFAAQAAAGSASAMGLRRMWDTGVLLAERLSPGSAPPPCVSDRVSRATAERAWMAMLAPRREARPWGASLADRLRQRERVRDRLRYAALWLLTPSHGDRVWLPLPPALYPLHYLLRPVRLATVAARRLARRRAVSRLRMEG